MFDIKPTLSEEYDLEVEVDVDEFADRVADLLSFRAQTLRINTSKDELKQYILGLVAMRVAYVRRELRADLRDYYDRPWVIPALVSVLLAQIGAAYDVEFRSIRISPVTKHEQPNVDTLHKGSRAMRELARHGVPVGTELPRDRRGSYEFMTTVLIQDTVKAVSSQIPPVYAFLASLTRNRMVEDIFSPRVSYGNAKRFSAFVDQFVDGDSTLDKYLPTTRVAQPPGDDRRSGSDSASKDREDASRAARANAKHSN